MLDALRRKSLLIAFLLLFSVPLTGQLLWKTAVEVTVAGTAVDLFVEADVVEGNGHPQATSATCSLTGANIRVSWDGQAPTTSLGEILVPGNWTLTGSDVLLNIQGIRDDSTSATWNCIINYGSGR